MQQQPEILLRLNAMGDILLLVPTLREFERKGIETHLVINERWLELSEFLPAKVHIFKRALGLWHLAEELQQLKPAAVHDLQGKLATIALRLMIKAPRKTQYIKRGMREQLRAIAGKFPLHFADQRPIWQKYAQTCGLAISKPDARLNLSEAYLQESRQLLKDFSLAPHQFIAVHADASKPGKALPQSLVENLQAEAKLPLVQIGTGTGPAATDKIVDLRNRISLHQLPGFLHLSAGLVSSDSGPMHLGRAVDIPVAGVFIQTSPSLGFAPVDGDKNLIISRQLPCKPCSLHGQRAICPEGHFACRDLDWPETVAQIFAFFRKFS